MIFHATVRKDADPDNARFEAQEVCRAIDSGQEMTLEAITNLEFAGDSKDGRTEIYFTCQGRQFRVRAATGK